MGGRERELGRRERERGVRERERERDGTDGENTLGLVLVRPKQEFTSGPGGVMAFDLDAGRDSRTSEGKKAYGN